MRVFYLARCHHCHDQWAPVPFGDRQTRDEWVTEHGRACGNPIDTWKEQYL